jgi:asparagine synthase (glutamine-hydrolysing)
VREQLWPYLSRLPLGLGAMFRPGSAVPPAQTDFLATPLMRAAAPASGSLVQDLLQSNGLGPVRSLGDYCVLLTRASSLPMLLRYEDRNSMAHSLEARVPYLDHRLVEFALALGSQHKIVGGDTKSVLRRALADYMPDKVVNRRDKLGFATPEAAWMRGPLKDRIVCGVEDTLTAYPDLFDATAVRQSMADRLQGRGAADFMLWRLYLFGLWGRRHGLTY